MRIPQRAMGSEVGFNMTPMIDVVFQLIIFFLVSSHLAKQEKQLDLPLPVADSGQKDTVENETRLTISLLVDGKILLAGHAVPPGELSKRLSERFSALGKDVEVRIRGDREVEYRHVEPILLACAELGCWNVHYAVFRREDVR